MNDELTSFWGQTYKLPTLGIRAPLDPIPTLGILLEREIRKQHHAGRGGAAVLLSARVGSAWLGSGWDLVGTWLRSGGIWLGSGGIWWAELLSSSLRRWDPCRGIWLLQLLALRIPNPRRLPAATWFASGRHSIRCRPPFGSAPTQLTSAAASPCPAR